MTYIAQPICPICGDANITETRRAIAPYFQTELAPDFSVNAGVVVDYVQCNHCTAWRQNPRLDDDSLNRYYSEGIYRATLNLDNDRMDADELHRAKFDAGLVKKMLGDIHSHLDIGCSRGHFLNEVGASVKVGVEPNQSWPMEGITTKARIDDVAGVFDLVSAIHVLEHEPYPLEFLASAKRHLNDDGKLLIEVPTWKSKGGPLRLAHLWHFEPAAMKTLMTMAGLRIVDATITPHLFVIAEAI